MGAQACAGVSLFFCLLWHIPYVGKMVAPADGPISVFLAAMWLVGTWTMTFEGPFKTASNGFFGAWVAGITAVSLGHYQYQEQLGGLFGSSAGPSEGEV